MAQTCLAANLSDQSTSRTRACTVHLALLRRFFFDLVATFFHVPARVVGTTEEWDEIMSEHAELRANLLSGFRKGADQRQSLEAKDAYMERHKTARPSSNVASINENTIIPAKRRANGARVKKEV